MTDPVISYHSIKDTLISDMTEDEFITWLHIDEVRLYRQDVLRELIRIERYELIKPLNEYYEVHTQNEECNGSI